MWVLCISGSYSHEKGSIIPQLIMAYHRVLLMAEIK